MFKIITEKCNEFGLIFKCTSESYTDDFMLTIPENHAVQEFSDYLVKNELCF